MALKKNDKTLVPVLLCGGEGARLWPVSRKTLPKPFIRLDGKQSFFQKTFLRAASLPHISDVLTVAESQFLPQIDTELNEICHLDLKSLLLLEPFPKNTAAAIASAALLVREKFSPDTLMMVMPADHLVRDNEEFIKAVGQACELASNGKIVTFGVCPQSPETGYGYIQVCGDEIKRFVEKPCLEDAVRFVSSGDFLWNSGMFCVQAEVLLKEMTFLCPEIIGIVEKSLDISSFRKGNVSQYWSLSEDYYKKLVSTPFDRAVMEKTNKGAVVPCNFGWADLGSWKSIGEQFPSDGYDNHIFGDVIVKDSKGCVIFSQNRLVSVLGLKDIVVVDTPDALLVTNKSDTQEVKSIFESLKESGHKASVAPTTVPRPWGSYTVLESGESYKVKRILVEPGEKLSLQSHQHRSEHWVVVQGKAKVANGREELTLSAQEHIFIPANCKHRLENIGSELLVVLEVQLGSYLEEDDIIRYEDSYNRDYAV